MASRLGRSRLVLRRVQTLTLNQIRSSHSTTLTQDDIISTAREVIESSPHLKSAFVVAHSVTSHPKAKLYPPDAQKAVRGAVFHLLKNHPDIDPHEAFMIKSSSSKFVDNENLTRDEVMARVIAAVKIYPNVCPSKVTEEADFRKDLGMRAAAPYIIMTSLQHQFKIADIPEDDKIKISSCKQATDYICDCLGETK